MAAVICALKHDMIREAIRRIDKHCYQAPVSLLMPLLAPAVLVLICDGVICAWLSLILGYADRSSLIWQLGKVVSVSLAIDGEHETSISE